MHPQPRQGWLRKENYIFGARKFVDIPEGIMTSHICELRTPAFAVSVNALRPSRISF